MAIAADQFADPDHEVTNAAIVGAKIVDLKMIDGKIIEGRIIGGRVIARPNARANASRARRIDTESFHSEIVAAIGLALILLLVYLVRF